MPTSSQKKPEAGANDNVKECIAEMRCFVRGGIPGIARLQQVCATIFGHFGIVLSEDICLVISSIGVGQNMQTDLLNRMNVHSQFRSANAGEKKSSNLKAFFKPVKKQKEDGADADAEELFSDD